MKEYYLGLDIGGTKCAVVLAQVEATIEIIDREAFATKTERGFDATWKELKETIEEVIRRNDLTPQEITAIGVCCGGPLDSRRGIVLCPPNLPGWVNIPLTTMLSDTFDIPAFLQNDANACALAEWKLGAGQGCQDMVFLTMGTGMGGGLIAQGQLLCGYRDMAGEIGHLRLCEEGPVGFGKAGSFEGYSSGGGLARQAIAYTERLKAEGALPAWIHETEAPIDAKLLATYARKGDEHALHFFQEAGRMLGRGLAILVDTLNPEKIIIGSVFVRCEELLRPTMEEELKREAIPFSIEKLRILPAALGEKLGDYAAVMVALHAFGQDDCLCEAGEKEAVLLHYNRLFERYPALEGLRSDVMAAYHLLKRCYRQGGKVMVMGNGGSCADGDHIVGELMKGFHLKRPLPEEMKQRIETYTQDILPDAAALLQQGMPAISLSGHAALNTAVINDQHPLLTGAQQLTAYGKPGDVLIGISTSGNARNVRLAAATAKAYGMHVIGLTGETGGKLSSLCDVTLKAPSTYTADVQEYHLPLYHTLCAMVEACFFDEVEV